LDSAHPAETRCGGNHNLTRRERIVHQEQVYTKRAQIIDVKFISDERAALKAVCGDGVRWALSSREHGEQVARELARELAPLGR
jgi:hypothetical protein